MSRVWSMNSGRHGATHKFSSKYKFHITNLTTPQPTIPADRAISECYNPVNHPKVRWQRIFDSGGWEFFAKFISLLSRRTFDLVTFLHSLWHLIQFLGLQPAVGGRPRCSSRMCTFHRKFWSAWWSRTINRNQLNLQCLQVSCLRNSIWVS